MKILLIGGKGFLGGRLASKAPGGAVILDRPECDILRYDQVNEAVERIRPEVVIHLAGVPDAPDSIEHMRASIDTSLHGTLNLLECLRNYPPRKFLFASSVKVYGDQSPFREDHPCQPRSAYGIVRLAAELLSLKYRALFPVAVLRMSTLYGPGCPKDTFIAQLVEKARRGERLTMTPGEQKREFLHVRDAASAFLFMAASPAEGIFNIGTGRSIALRDVVALIQRHAAFPVAYSLPYRDGEVMDMRSETGKVNALGWQARVSLEDGIKEMFDQ